jgi:phage host-nuclease inhibitor protein Gam
MLPSTAVLDRPAGPALLGPPTFSPPQSDPPTEVAPAQASATAPALATILFPDFPFQSSGTSDAEAPATEPFKIDTMDKAAWAASKVLESQARIDQRSELARSYRARIDAWLDSANQADLDSVAFLTTLLRPYVETAIAQQHRSRTLLLVSATVSLRKLPDRLEITDSAAALAFCQVEHPEAVIVKKELSRSVLKKLALDGTAIPGVAMELGADELYVKPSTERSLSCAS